MGETITGVYGQLGKGIAKCQIHCVVEKYILPMTVGGLMGTWQDALWDYV